MSVSAGTHMVQAHLALEAFWEGDVLPRTIKLENENGTVKKNTSLKRQTKYAKRDNLFNKEAAKVLLKLRTHEDTQTENSAAKENRGLILDHHPVFKVQNHMPPYILCQGLYSLSVPIFQKVAALKHNLGCTLQQLPE